MLILIHLINFGPIEVYNANKQIIIISKSIEQ